MSYPRGLKFCIHKRVDVEDLLHCIHCRVSAHSEQSVNDCCFYAIMSGWCAWLRSKGRRRPGPQAGGSRTPMPQVIFHACVAPQEWRKVHSRRRQVFLGSDKLALNWRRSAHCRRAPCTGWNAAITVAWVLACKTLDDSTRPFRPSLLSLIASNATS